MSPLALPHGLTRVLRPATATRVVRLSDWAFPPRSAPELEVIERLPEEPARRPPILFVHGLTLGAWAWENWLSAAAADGWPAYAVSVRGHGASVAPERGLPPLLRDYVADVMEAITRLPAPPVLVGHSIGSLVVQQVLERYPARAAVLVAPVASDTGLGTVLRLLKHQPLDTPALLAGRPVCLGPELMVHDEADDVAVRRLQERSVPIPTLVRYQVLAHGRPRRQRCPMVVVASPDDPLVPSRDARRVARTYGADLVEVPGLRHAPMLDVGWDGPAEAVLAWLATAISPVAESPAVRR